MPYYTPRIIKKHWRCLENVNQTKDSTKPFSCFFKNKIQEQKKKKWPIGQKGKKCTSFQHWTGQILSNRWLASTHSETSGPVRHSWTLRSMFRRCFTLRGATTFYRSKQTSATIDLTTAFALAMAFCRPCLLRCSWTTFSLGKNVYKDLIFNVVIVIKSDNWYG